MMRQMQLVESVLAYDPGADEAMINRAYVFAMKAHGKQTRASGDPYISHPLEVAGILTGYRMDTESIITAILHDTIEDTRATRAQIAELFGEDIARLVDGVTKLSKLELISDETQQAENFRKLLLAMSDDIRVLLVKLADRLHNMRTIGYLKPAKRERIAMETMEIYAPLAERVGLHEIKEELQDLSFQVMQPDAYTTITTRLQELRSQAGDLIPRMKAELAERLKKAGIKAKVTGREKRPFSIWRKLEQKRIPFEKLADVFGFRVIVDDTAECYRALGAIHQAYPMVPGEFDDYISTPKRNNYQSLHTVVIGPERMRTEIQFRSEDMHERAEFGLAAHWRYKEGSRANTAPAIEEQRWLRELLDILNDAASFKEFLDHSKLNMYADQVFCFTPKGDLISLPRGATAVDFAYAVHTGVGDSCVGAKINGKISQLRTVLQNGDQVEIVRSNVAAPSPTWEQFVVTGKARSRIRRFVRLRERDEHVRLGRAILERAFAQVQCDMSAKALKHAGNALGRKKQNDLFEAVGRGEVTSMQVVGAAYPEAVDPATTVARAKPRDGSAGDHAIPIRGLIPGMAVHFSDCCHPLPGDRIVGIVTSGKGVGIHTIDCDTLQQFEETPERWLDVSWSVNGEAPDLHVGRIDVVVVNEPGTLGAITTLIGRNNGNISNLKFTNRAEDFFEMRVDVEVRDVRHLTNIIAALRASESVANVERVRD